ncbi:protein patched isoform X1 [Diachasmimorpha longicaudata]|uniref:protein patched isoform X1 n=2 Tax=Diachasmimorpha longicaudata TaxID=58733 RepID=UPI0030B8A72C
MVTASGPTGILAGRPTASTAQSQQQNGTHDSQNNRTIDDDDRRRHESDLYVRPSWADAEIALDQILKGKAEGQRASVWIRGKLQDELNQLGYFTQRHSGKVLFVAVLLLATFCIALKSIQVHSKVEQLWIQDGGRLQKELTYVSEALGESAISIHQLNQLVIQTPRHSGGKMLHSAALKDHLAMLKSATQVTIDMYETTWGLKELCHGPSIPNLDLENSINQIFEKIIPCAIITPLDCFWEGSKLMDNTVHIPYNSKPLEWTSLNPSALLEQMKEFHITFPFKTLEDYMKRAGITNGYQSKPCLDPYDPECPSTAPNKNSRQLPDIGYELTGGCYGYAANYMHWPEELVVGGGEHNENGYLRRAAALQSVVQLMGEHEFYNYYRNHMKTERIEWTVDKASLIMESWQRAFSDQVKRHLNSSGASALYNSYTFSTITMNDILGKYSQFSMTNIAIGCGLILLYSSIVLLRWKDPVYSQAGIAIAGVLLVCATVAAGLGFCAILGIPFNAITTQIVPFLALGLGVHDIFLLTHTYAELTPKEVPINQQTGVVLKRTGLSVLLKGLSNVAAFFAASIIPIPALRTFSLQAGVLLLFNLAAMLLVFPAMISIDLRRRRYGRFDIFCCYVPTHPDDRNLPIHHRSSVVRSNKKDIHTDILPKRNDRNESWVGGSTLENCDNDKYSSEEDTLTGCTQDECLTFSLTQFAAKHYAPFVTKPTTKVFGILILAVVLSGSVWQAIKVEDGLDLTDLVPQGSDEHSFLTAQTKYFGFYNMWAITGRDFDYPNNQKLLHEYHDAFMRVNRIIKNDDGGLPKFWLEYFRDWLRNLQSAFDKDYRNGCITQERWYKNASDEGILAYKLLVQTGHADNPVDKTLLTQVKFVDSDGIINPRAFYNYLSAWVHNDILAYESSQANLRPQPRIWIFARDDEDLKIPKSIPLTYAQMPFYLHKLTDTNAITEVIKSIRGICKRFEEKGLPNFPSGIPFIFWEYMDLRRCLGIALISALGVSVVVMAVLLLNLWAALLVGTSLAGVVLQLAGIMRLMGMKLNAVPAVLLVISVGIAVHFSVHICLSFITSVGSRDRRVRLALEHMFAPIVHSALTTALTVMMLAFSDFEFIVRYFFLILICLIGIGTANGLFFFPILLSLVGPSPEVIPNEHPDRISTPTPPASPVVRRSKPPAPPRRPHKIDSSRIQSKPSLTTISEEPNSLNSTQDSCSGQPEVKVEATTTRGNQNCGGSDTSSSSRTSPVPSTSHHRSHHTWSVHFDSDRVTLDSDLVTVQVHTAPTSGMDRGEKCRHSSSSSRRSSRCSANINTSESSSSSSEPDTDNVNAKH